MSNTDFINKLRLNAINGDHLAIEKQQLNSFKTCEKYKYYHD